VTHYFIKIITWIFLGPYLASLNQERLLLDSEKGEKPEDKGTSKFGMDSDRSGVDRTGGNRYGCSSTGLADLVIFTLSTGH